MASLVENNSSVLGWDITKSKFDEINALPLMDHPGPVVLITALYLLTVLAIGPRLMRKREPMQLATTMVIYNIVQVFVSIYLVYKNMNILRKTGLIPTTCSSDDPALRQEMIIAAYLYFLAKVSELLDTMFSILKKKTRQISFLHVYHHSSMVLFTFITIKYALHENLAYICCANSFAHIILYSYYGLCAHGPWIGKLLSWKRYITILQLAQFVSMMIHYVVSMKYSACPPSPITGALMMSNMVFFFILFADFYRNAYKKKNANSKGVKIQNGAVKND